MDQRYFEACLVKQRAEVEKILKKLCLPRHASRRIGVDASLQILQGVRGSGKTFTTLHALQSKNVSFSYIDLSDRSLYALDAKGYGGLMEALLMVYGDFEYVVVDEFTKALNWRQCFDVLVRNNKKIVALVSGVLDDAELPENAAVLNFYPLSFSEYCIWHGIDTSDDSAYNKATIRKGFEDYLMRGGFPALQESKRPRPSALRLATAILENDIRGDFRKGMKEVAQKIGDKILSDSAEFINYKQLTEDFGLRSEITAKKCVTAVKGCGLLSGLLRFAMLQKVRNVFEKLYAIDPVYIDNKSRGKKLETVTYLQLRRFCERHGFFMHYYANRSSECNFALCINRKMRTIIQVIDDYTDSAAIKEKVAGLIEMSKTTGCNQLYILTDATHDELEEKGLSIIVVPVYEFLLDKSHKIISG